MFMIFDFLISWFFLLMERDFVFLELNFTSQLFAYCVIFQDLSLRFRLQCQGFLLQEKGLCLWLSCMWCFLVFLSLSHTVSWVRCGTWLCWFQIFAFFLSLVDRRLDVVKYIINIDKKVDRELLVDPLPHGVFGTLRFSKTTLYKTQNDTC